MPWGTLTELAKRSVWEINMSIEEIQEREEKNVEFNNKRWQTDLRNRPGLEDCQFPASSEIAIGGTYEQATIMMTEKGLNANMQDNDAAFEAWALALLLHCNVRTVKIGMGSTPGSGPHYERFLYRLKRFSELLPDLVKADWPVGPRALEITEKKRLLNQPNERYDPPNEELEKRMLAASAAAPSESVLEKALEVSHAFLEHFNLDKVMRQWPVGLFDGLIAKGSEIFTGRKSAIDLIGTRGKTLVLFELKKAGNRQAGAVSELLFYANVMRDAIGNDPRFEYAPKGARKGCAISPEDVNGCSAICGVLLGSPRNLDTGAKTGTGFHPLIAEPSMFQALNAATKRLYVDRPIHFEMAEITKYPHNGCGDFEFSHAPSNN